MLRGHDIIIICIQYSNANNNNIFLCARCWAAPLRWKCSALYLLCAMHSQLCADPAPLFLKPPAQARVKMTRARAVGSGGSTSCGWKEGGNVVRSALMNCVTVHETAKWDSPH